MTDADLAQDERDDGRLERPDRPEDDASRHGDGGPVARGFHGGQGRDHAGRQLPGEGRGLGDAARAVEQRAAEIFLQPLDLKADGAGRQPNLLRGRSKTAVTQDGVEGDEELKFQSGPRSHKSWKARDYPAKHLDGQSSLTIERDFRHADR